MMQAVASDKTIRQKVIKAIAGSRVSIKDLTAKDVAYLLSMPLYASALISCEQHYQTILPKILVVLEKLEKNAYAAWLYGRVLLSMQVMSADNKTIAELQKRIRTILSVNDGNDTAVQTWAWSYLAASYQGSEPEQYQAAKDKIQLLLQNQIRQKDTFTNLMWSITMAVVAAANNNDHIFYRKLLTVYIKTSLVDAVSQVPHSDYRAWLIANLWMAAKMLGDFVSYESLVVPLKQALAASSDSNDIMLAYATEVFTSPKFAKL